MAGLWRKTLMYLGLVEDDEFDEVEQNVPVEEPVGVRTFAGDRPTRRVARTPRVQPAPTFENEGIVRTVPPPTQASAIHRAEPRRFNEARELGEKFKEGVPVIMNLQETEDPTARRLVDFASGLVFALDGKIELVANRVYLLTPRNVEVSAEERERLREGDFFNQF
ncbi:MAG: cell division protein SepF [Actinomycetota bacterium]